MAKNKNYVPWNEYRHVETRRTDEDWENYLWKLSKIVGEACDRFFVSRGMHPGSVEIRTEAWKKRHEIEKCAGGSRLDGSEPKGSEICSMKSQGESDSKPCQKSLMESSVREA